MQKVKSRRSFFRYMAVLGLVGFYSKPLYAKTSKSIVRYQEMPEAGNRCLECLHFLPETNECKTVEGRIDPDGWCSIYFKNPKYKEK